MQKIDFFDLVKKKSSLLRLESLPETLSAFSITRALAKSDIPKPSYWRKCYDLDGLAQSIHDNNNGLNIAIKTKWGETIMWDRQ